MEEHPVAISGIWGFEEEITAITNAITDFESGNKSNIAIIAEPFAGKTTLINEIEHKNPGKTARQSLSSLIKRMDQIIIPDSPITVVDDCQYLFMRKVGGFDVLEDFIAMVAGSQNLFITTWNLFSWTYLEKVMELSVHFPLQINLPKLTADDIRTAILSRYGDKEIQFSGEVLSNNKIVELVRHQFSFRPFKKDINLPFIKISTYPLKTWFRKREIMTIEDIVFNKIHNISNGNPGVARLVWENSIKYPEINPDFISDMSYDVKLNYNEAFVLSIILSMRSITREELNDIAGFQTVHILSALSRQGLINLKDDKFGITPEALKSIVEFLKKLRLVW